jgi:hypothetical protein
MQAKHTQIIIAKEQGSDDTYEGYEFYKGKALQSIKGRKKEFAIKGKEKTIIELFFEGKPVQTKIEKTQEGKEFTVEVPDITLWLSFTPNGGVSASGDYISDFGLFYPVSGWFSKTRKSYTLEEKIYKKDNEYDQTAKAKFIEKYGEIITSIPEIEFSDEDLAMSDELFPQAQAFYDQYASEKAIEIEDLVNANAPRLMPGAAKKKAPVTQGQIDLAKDNLVKAKAKTAVETEEIPF